MRRRGFLGLCLGAASAGLGVGRRIVERRRESRLVVEQTEQTRLERGTGRTFAGIGQAVAAAAEGGRVFYTCLSHRHAELVARPMAEQLIWGRTDWSISVGGGAPTRLRHRSGGVVVLGSPAQLRLGDVYELVLRDHALPPE